MSNPQVTLVIFDLIPIQKQSKLVLRRYFSLMLRLFPGRRFGLSARRSALGFYVQPFEGNESDNAVCFISSLQGDDLHIA